MPDEPISLKFGRSGSFISVDEGMARAVRLIQDSWNGELRVFKNELQAYLDEVATMVADRNSGAFPGGTSATSLARRSGRSMDSVIRSVKVAGTTWEKLYGTIGGNATLAIHEFGGTIKSKGTLLAIPLPAALGANGTAPPFARQWKNTFVARSKKGNLLIFQKRGNQVVPLYVLVSSVKIPARLGLGRTLEERLPYFAEKVTDMVAADFMKQLGGR